MKPAAKQNDVVTAMDVHVVVSPSGVATPMSFPFLGFIDGALEPTVLIEHRPAAVFGSTATSTPHVPVGGTFQKPPSHRASIVMGGRTVFANHKPLARHDDPAMTCNDPADQPVGVVVVVAGASVLVG